MRALLSKVIEVITNRVVVLAFLFITLFSLIVVRLFYLQIVKGEEYESKLTTNYTRELEVEGLRGNIYDRFGRPLAINDYVYSIQYEVGNLSDEKMNNMLFNLINLLAEQGDKIINDNFPIGYENEKFFFYERASEGTIRLFKRDVFALTKDQELTGIQKNLTAEDMYNLMRKKFKINESGKDYKDILKVVKLRFAIFMNRYKTYKPIYIARDVSENTIVEIKEHQSDYPGVNITTDSMRVYPYGKYVSHMIGYLGPDSQNSSVTIGKSGIESALNLNLSGQDGKKVYEMDRKGNIVSEDMLIQPVQGNNVYLSIDVELQKKLYAVLEQYLANTMADNIVSVLPAKPRRSMYTIEQVYSSLIRNNYIQFPALISEGRPYTKKLVRSLDQEVESIDREFKRFFLSATQIKNYPKIYENLYIEFLQNLIVTGKIKTDYRKKEHAEFYAKYKQYETTALEFVQYCYDNKMLNKDLLNGNGTAKDIILKELAEFKKSKTFLYEAYDSLLRTNKINSNEMALVFFEQGKLTDKDDQVAKLKKGSIAAITVIRQRIKSLDIKPSELTLDPSTGSIVVSDVNTGSVMAMVSYPSYDNNRIREWDYYQKIVSNRNKPLINRPMQENTEPGSTFKMLTALAGLEEGVITPAEQIYAKGRFDKAIAPYPACWIYAYGGSHKYTNASRALEVSCNYFMSEVAYRFGTRGNTSYKDSKSLAVLNKYKKYLGLDSTTGIEIGENKPINESFDGLRAAFGNNQDLYTPAQLTRYTIPLANGGTTYELSIVKEINTQQGDQISVFQPKIYYQNSFKEESIRVIQKGMYDAAVGKEGTSRRVFKDFPMQIAGKTGTAQNSHGPLSEHALFTGYAPYNNPQIAVTTVLPYGGSSNRAAELFRDTVSVYFDLDRQPINEKQENTLYGQ